MSLSGDLESRKWDWELSEKTKWHISGAFMNSYQVQKLAATKVRPSCNTQAFFSVGLAELADCHSVSQPFIDLLVSSAEGKPSDRLNGFQIGNLMTDKVRFGQF